MSTFFRLNASWLALVLLAACGADPAATPNLVSTPTAAAIVATAPHAPTLLPTEEPPDGAASEFKTNFSKHSIPYSEILSGGPPKDGIPAIDTPRFVSIDEADSWLASSEPVILLQVGNEERAYPLQILMWHEIVNDTVGGVPVIVRPGYGGGGRDASQTAHPA